MIPINIFVPLFLAAVASVAFILAAASWYLTISSCAFLNGGVAFSNA
jgi:hypothetical protein